MTKIKFNSGMGAILCENCSVIMATGHEIPTHIMTNPSPNEYFFCSEECRDAWFEKKKRQCRIFQKSKDNDN